MVDVSVVIPTFRREKQVLGAIRSALCQDGVGLDDSPEASARDGVLAIADERLTYLVRPQPSGGRPALVRNDGAQRARGSYLYFLDDDDELQPDTLRTLRAALDARPEAGMAFGAVEPFGDDPVKLAQQRAYFANARRVAGRLRSHQQLAAWLMFRSPPLINSACMARRSTFLACGGYDGSIPVCEDADLWSRIAQSSGFVFVDRPVVRYRTGAASLMNDLAEQDPRLGDSYRIMQNKYRARSGPWRFLQMKLWAKLAP